MPQFNMPTEISPLSTAEMDIELRQQDLSQVFFRRFNGVIFIHVGLLLNRFPFSISLFISKAPRKRRIGNLFRHPTSLSKPVGSGSFLFAVIPRY